MRYKRPDGKCNVLNRGGKGLGKQMYTFAVVVWMYDLRHVSINQSNMFATHYLDKFRAAYRYHGVLWFGFSHRLV